MHVPIASTCLPYCIYFLFFYYNAFHVKMYSKTFISLNYKNRNRQTSMPAIPRKLNTVKASDTFKSFACALMRS